MKTAALCSALVVSTVLCLHSPAISAEDVVIEVTSIAALSDSVTSSADTTKEAADRPALKRSKAAAIDPRLSSLSKKLHSLFAYSHYSFLEQSRAEAGFGGNCVIDLPERFALEVEPSRSRRAKDGRLELMVTLTRDVPSDGTDAVERSGPEKEIVLRTRIRLENGGTVLLGGPPIKQGVLILALSARS